MSKGPSNVRISDLKRGLKGLESAGAKVARVEIEGGKIVYILDNDTPGANKATGEVIL